jgi:hypothetical protein
MYLYKLLIAIIFTSSISLQLVYAGSCENYSATSRKQLIELYTSEGCSSCPPADSWLRALVPQLFSADEVVPLAFHVDYWDRLEWRDRFASPLYTSRQSAYSKVSGSSFMFTPQVIIGGRNYSAWSDNSRVQQGVREALKALPDADIALRLQAVAAGKIGFEISTKLRQGINPRDVHIYAALFQNGLVSDVGRGENSGSRLQHDYVVRELIQSKTIDQSGKLAFRGTFTLPDDARPVAMGVAVFAQDTKTGKVLQAMAAPLCIKKL